MRTNSRLLDAAIRVACSEVGSAALLRREKIIGSVYEDWPAMGGLLTTLDAVSPRWRTRPTTRRLLREEARR